MNQSDHNAAPVIISEQSLRALRSIRHDWIVPEMYPGARILVARSALDAVVRNDALTNRVPDWIEICQDPEPSDTLPDRLRALAGTDRATIELALIVQPQAVLIEGKSMIEKVKLSFIPALSVVSLLVQAFRTDCIRAVRPLLRSLEKKGFELPPPEQMQALNEALTQLGEP